MQVQGPYIQGPYKAIPPDGLMEYRRLMTLKEHAEQQAAAAQAQCSHLGRMLVDNADKATQHIEHIKREALAECARLKASADAQLAMTQSHNQELQQQLAAAQASERSGAQQLQQQQAAAQDEQNQLAQQLASEQSRAQQLEQQLAAVQASMQNHVQQSEQQRATAHASEQRRVEQLEQQLAAARASERSSVQQLEQLLEATQASAQSRVEQLEQQLAASHASEARYAKQLQQRAASPSKDGRLAAQLAAAQSQCRELERQQQEQARVFESVCTAHREALEASYDDNEMLKSQLQQMQQQKESAEAQVVKARAEVEQSRAAEAKLQEAVATARLAEEAACVAEQRATTKHRLANSCLVVANKRAAELQAMNQQLQAQNQQLLADNQQLSQQVQRVQQLIEALVRQHAAGASPQQQQQWQQWSYWQQQQQQQQQQAGTGNGTAGKRAGATPDGERNQKQQRQQQQQQPPQQQPPPPQQEAGPDMDYLCSALPELGPHSSIRDLKQFMLQAGRTQASMQGMEKADLLQLAKDRAGSWEARRISACCAQLPQNHVAHLAIFRVQVPADAALPQAQEAAVLQLGGADKVKKVYKELSLRVHPDKVDRSDWVLANEAFKGLGTAYAKVLELVQQQQAV